ncbi:hypothetical protein MSG28_015744 [Choristoneura fumiferana]|uniref:Uncharacterized protein n=1 Tax=Choristoneura fumiferana TaxID=7141 RepID=A0ACC0KBG1_CHOFU|nr:hypothetical protein MSG28_015744 [Choristoneura fumiferana]
MEDYRTAMNLLSPGDYMAKIDIKESYLLGQPSPTQSAYTNCRDIIRQAWLKRAIPPASIEAFLGVCRRPRTFGSCWQVGRRQGICTGSVPHQRTASLPGYQRHSVRALAIAPYNLGLQSSGNVGTNERPLVYVKNDINNKGFSAHRATVFSFSLEMFKRITNSRLCQFKTVFLDRFGILPKNNNKLNEKH